MLPPPDNKRWSDPEEIAANRRGEITARQRAGFGSATRASGCAALAMLAGFVFLGVPAMCVAYPFVVPQPGLVPLSAMDLALALLLAAVALGALIVSLRYALRQNRVLRELRSGTVAHAAGRVDWLGKRYVLAVPGGRLHYYGQLNLAPGEYEFFHLARSRYLLSALPASRLEARSLLAALEGAHGFRSEALDANRAGRLDASQARLLARSLSGALVIAALAVALTALLIVPLVASASAEQAAAAQLCGTVLIVGMALLAAVVFLRRGLRLLADLRRGRVSAVEGPVRKVHVRASRRAGSGYFYQVDGLRLSVTRAGYNALVEGLNYRVYFIPRSRVVVAIEPLAPGAIVDPS